jgi:hypothetical protein
MYVHSAKVNKYPNPEYSIDGNPNSFSITGNSDRWSKNAPIKVMSAGKESGDYAKIYMNGKMIHQASSGQRGFVIAIINPDTFAVEATEIFDTHASSTGMQNWINQDKVPDGYLVAIGCIDECMNKLTSSVKQWFKDMGSLKIDQL